MIEADKLTKRYGDFTAIEDLSFKVGAGEVVGFLGVNGACKTTTMRILSCFQPASAGKASVAGFDCFKQSLEVRRSIGYLPESVPLYPELRVAEYLAFRARIKGVPGGKVKSEIARVVGRCKIEDRARQTIGTLSRGYRQRVGLADALLGPPKILILDEPTSGLDPLQRAEVRDLLLELGKEHTVLLSTHILSEVEATCARVIIIHGGKLVPDERVAKLRAVRRYEAAIAGPQDNVLGALRQLAAVDAVEVLPQVKEDAERSGEPPHTVFELIPKNNEDPRTGLTELLASKKDAGWKLLELRRKVLSLEEVFARATGGGT
ncbi:MAG: ATP-binding cassette domain-containing protein [Planctomycetes bacterium]|nr:ATP-binding cassette domain-containing protein [Planctomycetota bacterium]